MTCSCCVALSFRLPACRVSTRCCAALRLESGRGSMFPIWRFCRKILFSVKCILRVDDHTMTPLWSVSIIRRAWLLHKHGHPPSGLPDCPQFQVMSQYSFLSTPDPEYAPLLAKMQLQLPKALESTPNRGIEATMPQDHLESRLPAADKIRIDDRQIASGQHQRTRKLRSLSLSGTMVERLYGGL